MIAVFPLSGPHRATISPAVNAPASKIAIASRINPLRRSAAELGEPAPIGSRAGCPTVSVSVVVMPRRGLLLST